MPADLMSANQMHRYVRDKIGTVHSALGARRAAGKGLVRQCLEILSLRLGRQKLTVSEYYAYGLYDDRRFSRDAKRRFGGTRVDSRLDRALNDKKWHCLTQDKVITHLLLESLGLPHPRLLALFDAAPRLVPGVSCLTTPEQLRSFLAGADYPLFAKPVGGSYGWGAMAVRGFAPEADDLELAGGVMLSLSALLDLHRRPQATGNSGYLFQELVEPHPSLRSAFGERLCSLRVIAFLDRGRPEVFGANLKIPTGTNVTDNFDHGHTGNLVANVDVASGRIVGTAKRGPLGFEPVACHPDTGTPLQGLALPDWKRCLDLVLGGASAFPGLRYQHWDVALGTRGPVVLELNVDGSLEGLQAATGQGWLLGPLRNVFDSL